MKKIAAVVQELTEAQRETIRAAAEGNGFEIHFFDTAEEDPAYLKEAEVLFGHLPQITRDAPKLKWICTPYAGVDQFLAKDAFANFTRKAPDVRMQPIHEEEE